MTRRPLSPHVFIYRFAYTMALSILHRATGVAMALGLAVLTCWLVSVSLGESSYQRFASWAGTGVFRFVLALWLLAFLYHFANGIRHLAWDAGFGLERAQARRSGRIVIAVVAGAGLVLGYLLFFSEVPR
jgi:succinate dehydrogenase / fumarate reductase, cytochrome b subunit